MAVGVKAGQWDEVWAAKAPDEVSWFQPSPLLSLELIEATGVPNTSRVVDVGGGACTLVDHLLDRGYDDVWVVDIAEAPLTVARCRCGDPTCVHWVVANVLDWRPESPFDVWHDRAVFHFMVDDGDRARYLETLRAGVAPGGHVVIATFALDGPGSCSGLPVARYDPEGLSAELGPDFEPVEFRREEHRTPAGTVQAFQYGRFVRRPGS